MAIEKLTPDNFELFTLVTNPKRTFISSSSGVTGTLNVFARQSDIEKEVQPLSLYNKSFFEDQFLDEIRVVANNATSSNVTSQVQAYMDAVNEQQPSLRKRQTQEIIRFTPSFRFSSNTLRKNVVRKTLMPYYRTVYPTANFNYSNYHCLNFFTGSNVPSDSAILYPNSGSTTGSGVPSVYEISGAFTFDFWIKPKYVQDAPEIDYKPGCLLHLTSAYALSLHTGSRKDINGYPSGFRLALALSGDANTSPSELETNNSDLLFWTADNALDRNQWHHVTFRWGGENYNFGSGSVIVDGNTSSTFTITESLLVGRRDPGAGDPSVLVVGNYYEGENVNLSAMDRFFAEDTAEREGLLQLNNTDGIFGPTGFDFTHPLNAEVHDIKLYNKYLTLNEIGEVSASGPTSLDNLKFYLPPFFTEESPFRKFVGSFGGLLVTPFFEKDGTSTTPFASDMAFGAGGHYMNLENHVRDFATGLYPRLWNLTGSTFEPPSSTELSANAFLYGTGSNIKRLYTILPCDNGKFLPNFDLLANLSGSSFIDDLGVPELGVVSLNDMVPNTLATKGFGLESTVVSKSRNSNDVLTTTEVTTSNAIVDDLLGPQPDKNLVRRPNDSLAILHRTRDESSNQIVFFDISNLYYGNRIKPGTLKLVDTSVSHSAGKIKLSIKDDGYGNLYRADVTGSHPTWASIGNVFYDEGVILLKHPSLYFFGEERYEVKFEGEHNVHVLSINAFARAGRETSSSNPSFVPFDSKNGLANVTDEKAVWINGILIHDDNLNIIMRGRLAQPLLKRSNDKFLFKLKLDF